MEAEFCDVWPQVRGSSQFSFSQAPELVRDGPPRPRRRATVHRTSPKPPADRIDGSVCARSRHAFLGARATSFAGKAERQLQLQDRLRVEM
jgi:hypothetical protein